MRLRPPGRRPHRAVWLALVLLALGAGSAHAQVASSGSKISSVDYIDGAIPVDMIRLRFDAAYDMNRSDRAAYIYSPGFDSRIDYQDYALYFEKLLGEQFSIMAEIHEHAVNPTESPNDAGFGDMTAGFKWAFWSDEDRTVSFQLKTYIPSGNSARILGNGHTSVEPALLFFQRLNEQLTLEGELRDWIPVGATAGAGNVLRYGAGLGYRAFNNDRLCVTPVLEFVGWTVLSGRESVSPDIVQQAYGDTIVNAKMGVRVGFENYGEVYVGYGRALTGDYWYKDFLRVDYRLRF